MLGLRSEGVAVMDNAEYEKMKENWESRLKAGPVFSFNIDLPMTVIREKEGGLSIDCVWGQIGNFQPAAIARVHLTEAAIKSLLRAMDIFEKNQDVPSVEIRKPIAN
jgi:hypothetical protein